VTESLVKNLPPSKLFFSGENKKKFKTTLIQIPMHTVGEMTVFAPDYKRTFWPLTPASEVVLGRALHFWKEVAETNLKW
jgi:hypothetical protein